MGTPVLGLLEFQRSRGAHFGVKAQTASPLELSSAGGRRHNQSGSAVVPLLHSCCCLLKRLLWLQDDFVSFSFLSQLVFWQCDALLNQTVTLVAPVLLQMHFYDSKVAPDSGLTEWACSCVQTYRGSQLLWNNISLLFASCCCTSHDVGKIIFSKANYLQLITLFISVRGWKRLLLWFLVLFMMYPVFDCHSYRFQKELWLVS